jgi:hypothetical protein
VASKSAVVDFPDFTRGKWRSAKPIYPATAKLRDFVGQPIP